MRLGEFIEGLERITWRVLTTNTTRFLRIGCESLGRRLIPPPFLSLGTVIGIVFTVNELSRDRIKGIHYERYQPDQ